MNCLNKCIALSLFFVFSGCVEEIDFKIENFERILVIEGTITNENKKHEILLSNSFRFEDQGPTMESGALVQLLVNNTPTYTFIENSPGKYVSNQAFEALQGIDYTLFVKTQDGREFSSSAEQLPPVAEIQEVNAVADLSDLGESGVSLRVSNYSHSGNAYYYRFEYEETYKIIAPFWSPFELVAEDEDNTTNCNVLKTVRQQEERICFNTKSSIEIIVAETLSLQQDQLNDFEFKFIKKDNTIIAHRYSILLKQFVVTQEAFNYYKKRRDFGDQGNVFFQTQPGFVEGNIMSLNSPDEKVIGFFSVSTVSSLRYFFNWDDLFPGEDYPRIHCSFFSPALTNMVGCYLKKFVISNQVKYYNDNVDPQPGEGPFIVVNRPCGDCTATGYNVEPDFWIE